MGVKGSRMRPHAPAPMAEAPTAGAAAIEAQSTPAAELPARGVALDKTSPEFVGAKRDSWPARQRWAPGGHLRRCTSDHAKFVGALNSATCADRADQTEPAV
jgi:hypothetical protein